MGLIKNRLTRSIMKMFRKAHIPRPDFPAINPGLNKALLIACSASFEQDQQIAATLMREGFARGWAEVCGPSKLVSTKTIIRELDLHNNPAVFISEYELNDLSYPELKKLRDVDLLVWVSVHPRTLPELNRRVLAGSVDNETSLKSYSKIIYSEPKFVWNAVGQCAEEWYHGWIDDGLVWETIYPGVDSSRYFYEPNTAKYGHIKMAYVGGYWPEKAQSFDAYFRRWEEIFSPYGYNIWPYKHYSGELNPSEERQLYSSAGMIPLVTSPHGWIIAEITERYVKAPACKAFCISDQNPALREVFKDDEMIQAQSAEHFHDLVNDYLTGKIDIQLWKTRAYNAVFERHLYKHRALQIKNRLESL